MDIELKSSVDPILFKKIMEVFPYSNWNVKSFSWNKLSPLREFYCAALWNDYPFWGIKSALKSLSDMKIQRLDIHKKWLLNPHIKTIQQFVSHLWCWTANDETNWKNALKIKTLSGVITDEPDKARNFFLQNHY